MRRKSSIINKNINTDHLICVLRKEGIKNRHKLKMMVLDIITFFAGIYTGTEAFKAVIAYNLTPLPGLISYGIGMGVASMFFILSYYQSYFKEKNCEVCQER